MEAEASKRYLQALINKSLKITTGDGRFFLGLFKVVDSERNIILSQAFEYREPSDSEVAAAAKQHQGGSGDKFRIDMTSRFLGLIVVPGQHITKIELE